MRDPDPGASDRPYDGDADGPNSDSDKDAGRQENDDPDWRSHKNESDQEQKIDDCEFEHLDPTHWNIR
jgi:hypothetical protein